jgi:hypothetical protein
VADAVENRQATMNHRGCVMLLIHLIKRMRIAEMYPRTRSNVSRAARVPGWKSETMILTIVLGIATARRR